MMNDVRAWEEKLVLPTYLPAEPEKNPIFLEKRVYQGSSGAVYPNPVIEKIAREKSDREYTALWIENKYLRILVLPELGGRIHRAFDKIRNRDFVYYNSVVKPALVGLTGPWISGGIEFNWPQHHRPSTFDPIDYSIQDNEDGSKTIWVNEIEVMSRTKGMAGFTLYPDKAYLEIKGRLFNRTPLPQTFLWWANPAVKVNDHYQSIFPPDVHAVFDHGKRDVSDFPIATGTYYKVNYAPGTDISRYKNIPVPTSFMAAESKYDFIGGYEHDTRAGMLHVADHHFSPGKKQWTWGNGDFGKAWDRNLTDEDGPYIELMCGVYTDNQPDFSWLQPNEEKTFEQYFMPYAEIGVVHCASKDVAVSFELQGQKAEKGRGQKAEGNETDDVICRIYSSGEYPGAQIELSLISGHRAEGGGRFSASSLLFSKSIDLSPEKPLSFTIQIPGDVKQEDLRLEICDATGELLLSYHPDGPVKKPIPPAATAAKEPAEVETTEQLYLNGLHLEQYRHATFSATAYYEEALRREPNDIRNNNALGKWYLRHGQPEKAEAYLRKAVKAITVRNGNPYDGEPLYNLGLCLCALEQFDEAYDVFYKSTWNDAFQHNGYLQLARIAVRRGEFKNALYLVDKSLNRNYNSTAARHLKVSILRRLGRTDEAVKLALCALKADPFSLGCEFELKLMNAGADKRSFARKTFNNYTETALDYAHAGMYKEAELLLRSLPTANDNPLKHYYMGWFNLQMNNADAATEHFTAASETPADFCFPSRTEDTVVLKAAVAQNPSDAKAQYLLGNYWYAHHNQNEAIACWERSVELDPSFPTAFRNLALAYYNHANDPQKAIEAMEKAFELDNKDARVLMELDQLYRQLNYSAWFRLNLLEEHVALVEQRHDLYLERVTLYNQIGDHETADALMSEWKFQPWEGGEGKVVSQFILCQTELAKQAMNEEEYEKAITLLSSTDSYPENLGEGKLPNVPANDLHYWKGVVYEKKGEQNLARQEFEAAMSGGSEATQAIFYNDAGPEHVFFKGKALQKTGRAEEAKQLFQNLIHFGEEHMHDEIKIDYFAVSLPDLRVFNQDLNLKNRIHCNYLLALGYLGLGKKETADKYFEEVLKRDANHQGALQMRHDCLL